jgi:hypothetical protein
VNASVSDSRLALDLARPRGTRRRERRIKSGRGGYFFLILRERLNDIGP